MADALKNFDGSFPRTLAKLKRSDGARCDLSFRRCGSHTSANDERLRTVKDKCHRSFSLLCQKSD